MNNLEELKSLAQLMTERFSMNPVSSQILSESWINAFPDEPAIAHKFLALIAQLEAAQIELSAANEKLSKPVVLPSLYDPQIAGNAVTRAECFANNRAVKKCATAIESAGFTVEGE